MAKNFKGLYNKIDEDVVKEKLKELYKEIVGTKRTSYYQHLVLWEDGTLEIHRLGQNESLQSEFKGEAITLYTEREFNITDIEGWLEDDVDLYMEENINDWYYSALERIEDKLNLMEILR